MRKRRLAGTAASFSVIDHQSCQARLTRAIVQLASQYGRYGYRRITAVLQRAGWNVGRDRVQRIWRREGLKVPAKQKPRDLSTTRVS